MKIHIAEAHTEFTLAWMKGVNLPSPAGGPEAAGCTRSHCKNPSSVQVQGPLASHTQSLFQWTLRTTGVTRYIKNPINLPAETDILWMHYMKTNFHSKGLEAVQFLVALKWFVVFHHRIKQLRCMYQLTCTWEKDTSCYERQSFYSQDVSSFQICIFPASLFKGLWWITTGLLKMFVWPLKDLKLSLKLLTQC